MGELIPIVAIIASAWVFVTMLHYRHGGRGKAASCNTGRIDNDGERESNRLAVENQNLKHVIERLEDRIAVLERIATDPAERTAREIEQLRHIP